MSIPEQFQQFSDLIAQKDVHNPSVSKSNVGWHIEHSLKVTNQIIKTVVKSNPEDFKQKFSLMRLVILTLGIIPRGKGKAPKSVNADDEVEAAVLHEQLKLCKVALKTLKNCPRNCHFKHPVFGILNRDEALKFIKIHTQHHLKIIKDIIA